jgi:hypothetical protein
MSARLGVSKFAAGPCMSLQDIQQQMVRFDDTLGNPAPSLSTDTINYNNVWHYDDGGNDVIAYYDKNSQTVIDILNIGTVGNAFTLIEVADQDTIEADSAADTLTLVTANGFLVITTNASSDTLTFSVVITAGDGITITGTTLSASGEIAIVTSEIDARTDTTGPSYTMGAGEVTLMVRDSPGVYTTVGGSTGVTCYNSTQAAVPADAIIQCKWIKGDLFVDVGDCS